MLLSLSQILNLYQRLAPAPLWANATRLCSSQVATTAQATAQASSPSVTPVGSDVPDKLFSRVELQMKGVDPEVMKSYAYFAKTPAEHLDIEVGKQYVIGIDSTDQWK